MLTKTEREAQLADYYRDPRHCEVCGETIGALSVSLNDAHLCPNYSCRNSFNGGKWRVMRSEQTQRLEAELESLRAERDLLKLLLASAVARA